MRFMPSWKNRREIFWGWRKSWCWRKGSWWSWRIMWVRRGDRKCTRICNCLRINNSRSCIKPSRFCPNKTNISSKRSNSLNIKTYPFNKSFPFFKNSSHPTKNKHNNKTTRPNPNNSDLTNSKSWLYWEIRKLIICCGVLVSYRFSWMG